MVDPGLGERRRALHLIDADGAHRFFVRPDVAEAAGVGTYLVAGEATADATAEAVVAALTAAGERFHDPDHVFYLTAEAREALLAERDPEQVRALTAADAAAFAAFQAANSPEDRDEAFVELDHEIVLGVVEPDGSIVCVSSAYGWDGTALSDIGILTAPEARGRGLARQLVRAMSRAIIAAGQEPQYRCGVENTGSRAVAEASGFTRFGTWRVVTGEAPAAGAPPVH